MMAILFQSSANATSYTDWTRDELASECQSELNNQLFRLSLAPEIVDPYDWKETARILSRENGIYANQAAQGAFNQRDYMNAAFFGRIARRFLENAEDLDQTFQNQIHD